MIRVFCATCYGNFRSLSPSDLKYPSTSSSVTCCSVGGSHLGLLSLSTSAKIIEYNIANNATSKQVDSSLSKNQALIS